MYVVYKNKLKLLGPMCWVQIEGNEILTRWWWRVDGTTPIFKVCCDLWKDFLMATNERCDREANQVVHELALQALETKFSCTWVDSQPTFITVLLVNGVTLLSDK